MPSSAIRQYFSSYDPPTGRNDGFLGPPQEGPPDDNGGGIVQPPPMQQPRDASQLAAFRANRIRDYLAQNPNRRPGPMGRNPDGSINWDTSTGIGAAGAAEDERRRAQLAQMQNRQQIGPGSFNAAAPNPVAGNGLNEPRLGTGGGGGY
jgi:hypothetical protein